MKRSTREEAAEVDSSINLANTLMLLSRGEGDVVIPTRSSSTSPTSSSSSRGGGRVFECKTCDRQFPSFQALGGHRAGHKKLKIVLLGHEHQDGHGQKLQQSATSMPPQKKPKVHECPICGLEFSMGQALGGHMRRHRAAADQGLIGGHGFVEKKQSSNGKRVMLDLNLPPLEEDGEGTKLGVGLGLGLGLVCT